jgi:indolepyruvate ferredoxin oxidoreductase
MLITGVGGTGVVTIGAVLGMAAHMEGKGCGILDMAGMAQKGGSVWSHLRFGATPDDIKAIRVASGGADLVLGCDLVVSASNKTLSVVRQGHTRMLVNAHEMMTGEFTRHPDMRFPADSLRDNIRAATGAQQAEFIDATRLATLLHGDAIAANMFMLGYAFQRGLIPVSAEAINQAITLNGAAVAMNQDAFLWGRRAAHDMKAVARLATPERDAASARALSTSLDELIARRREFLTHYQDAAYAERYALLVERVRKWEVARFGRERIAEAVARYYFKLLAYKDEYEVARLQSAPEFHARLKQQFEGKFRIAFNLAPPGLARNQPGSGEPKKKEFGPWLLPVLRMLAAMKSMRGGAFDIFGYSAERRAERALIGRYESTVAGIIEKTSAARYETALKLAIVPDMIRGYGHVKRLSMERAEVEWTKLTRELEAPPFIEVHRIAS